MAEIRCPMCGKSASDVLEICPFCQARLKPLIISSNRDDGSGLPGKEQDKDDTSEPGLADSINSTLLGEEHFQSADIPAENETSEIEFEPPDWLLKLREQTSLNEPDTEPESIDQLDQEEQESPDDNLDESWDIPETSENSSTHESGEVELQDAQSESEVPDWLSGLAETAQEEDESPVWLSKIENLPKKEDTPFNPVDEYTPKGENNWLDGLKSDSSDQELEVEQVQGVSSIEEPVFDEDAPDWMKKLQAEVDTQTSTPQTDIENRAEGGDEDSPDWLSRLQAETLTVDPSSEDVASEQVDQAPDWLEKMSVEVPSTSQEDDLIGSDTPEWLRNLQAETQAFAEDIQPDETDPQAVREESQSLENDTPEWMKELDSDIIDSTEEEISSSVFQDPTKIIAEMNEAEEIEKSQATLPQNGSDEFDELMPDDFKLINEGNEFDQQAVVDQVEQDYDELQPDSDMIPDWLKNIEKGDTNLSDTPALVLDDQSIEMESGESISTEIPEWVKSLDKSDEDSLPEEELEAEEDGDAIKPADLPSWVQDMRPVETMVADGGVSDEQLGKITETVGPLAGLQGVLPATPGIGKLRKPLNYSIKLRVTDDQSLQAEQLEQMLGVESQAKPTSSLDKKLPQQILRWVVSILVFLVVALPVVGGQQTTTVSTFYPPELVAAREIIFTLPPSSPVLLVFDYEPAYSGELEVTAAPMLENLLITGTRLVILSTNPTGPAMAEHFLRSTLSQHNYQSGLHYSNLGYLAGGASGVLSFVLNPSQTMPKAIDDSFPWQSPLLQDVQSLADFKAVIILTDNSDTAKVWVEQTGKALGETPLLMAISAQAEPMIRPYYDSKQVKGLVTGLAGGKAYEQSLQYVGLGQKYWDSFSYGLFIAEITIIFSALWSIVSIWRNRQNLLEEEV